MANVTGTPCTIVGCGKPILARGWCPMHYARWKKYGDPGEAAERRQKVAAPCSIDGCDVSTKSGARGWCPKHYVRWRQYGDPLLYKHTSIRCEVCGADSVVGAKRDGLCRDHYKAWVIAEVVAGRISPNAQRRGYQYISIFKKQYAVHRLVLEDKIGRQLVEHESPHHINGRRDDNRPENLELWVRAQPSGQRAVDLVEWVVRVYPVEVRQHLDRVPS